MRILLPDIPEAERTPLVQQLLDIIARKAEGGKPLLSSIVYADPRARPLVVKILREPSGAVARLGPALAPGPLDDRTLAAGPGYVETLQQILIHALVKQQDQQP